MGTLDLVSRRAEECKLKMSAMLFLLPLLLCGVHSKHFLIETQDTDVQSEDLVNQQDGIGTELDYGNAWKTKADGSKGKTKADGSKGKKIGADYCWPWWMCPM